MPASLAACKSSSAYRTHWAVSGVIKNLAFFGDLAEEPIVLFQTTFDLLRRANNDGVRKQPFERSGDSDSLINHVVGRHDHQQVDVAFGVRLAVGVGAEEDDLFRMETFGNLSREAADRRKRDVRRRVAVRLDIPGRSRSFGGHGFMVSEVDFVRAGHTVILP